MNKFFIIFSVFLLLPIAEAFAADDVSVTLRLDRIEASLSDTLRMEIHVSGSRSSDAEPKIRGLDSFLVSRGGTSSRVEIINGKVSSGVDYTYYIQPQKTGRFKIGPAMIRLGGKTVESESVMLTISSAPQTSGVDRGPVFLNASVSHQDIYVDQHILYTLKLYYRKNINRLSLILPEIENVTIKQLGQPLEYQSTYAGLKYQVLEVRHVLTASKQGDIAILPSRMKMDVQQTNSRSLFDNFFSDSFSGFTSGRPLIVASDPIKLNVNELPEEGKPSDFTGLVGAFQMASTLAPNSLKTSESATLTVQIKGHGTINRIPNLDIPELNFARIYADQPVLETEQKREGIYGIKTMKWALVPDKAGEYEIPLLSLSYFNPETKQYHTLETSPHTISVLPDESSNNLSTLSPSSTDSTTNGIVKQEVQQLGEDILPIHSHQVDLSVPFRSLSSGWLLWMALFGPAVIYLFIIGALQIRQRTPEQLIQSKSKKAYSILKKECQNNQSNYEDLMSAFQRYFNDRFQLSVGTLTAPDAERLLKNQGISSETAEKACKLIQRLEASIYAGSHFEDKNAASEMLDLVASIEKEI